MRVVGFIAICLGSGCVPELQSPGPPDLSDWACPENSWDCDIPPATLQDSSIRYGFFPGDTLPRGLMVDQHGDMVDPWQFFGQVVVVDISTMWCSPCRQIACYVQHTHESYVDHGVTYLTVLPQNTHGEPPSVSDLQDWARDFKITAPILSDPEHGWSRPGTPTNSYPALVVVDREMKVYARIEVGGPPDAVDMAVRRAVEEVGGLPPNSEAPKSYCDR
ncbi:MAG: TlpA family protein disulfide reductase [Deltaproteobacteria bacterium]|nr:MAG: TlpA family protein disulfide reductase [Deltaproteobacteria bacterium]